MGNVALIKPNNENRVDARGLWEFLRVKTRFNDWVERRIKECEFVEDQDFYSYLSKTSHEGGRPSTEYSLTIPAAKHFAMMERNELGKQARDYFIQCEGALVEIAERVKTLYDAVDKSPTIQRIEGKIDILDTRVDRIENKIDRVDGNVIFLAENQPRKQIQPWVVDQHIITTEKCYQGMCPCCRKRKVVKDGKKLGHAEHFKNHASTQPNETWITCKQCNEEKRDGKLSDSYLDAQFRAYQACRERLEQEGKFKVLRKAGKRKKTIRSIEDLPLFQGIKDKSD